MLASFLLEGLVGVTSLLLLSFGLGLGVWMLLQLASFVEDLSFGLPPKSVALRGDSCCQGPLAMEGLLGVVIVVFVFYVLESLFAAALALCR